MGSACAAQQVTRAGCARRAAADDGHAPRHRCGKEGGGEKCGNVLRRCNHTEKRPQRVLEQDLFQLKLCWIVGKKRVEPKEIV